MLRRWNGEFDVKEKEDKRRENKRSRGRNPVDNNHKSPIQLWDPFALNGFFFWLLGIVLAHMIEAIRLLISLEVLPTIALLLELAGKERIGHEKIRRTVVQRGTSASSYLP